MNGEATRFGRGEKNINWKGDSVSDQVGRDRARRWFPGEIKCAHDGCESIGERHHRDGNTRNNAADNIQFLCHGHHMQIDLCGKPKSVEHRAAIAATLRGRTLTPEHRSAVSAGLRAWWNQRKNKHANT